MIFFLLPESPSNHSFCLQTHAPGCGLCRVGMCPGDISMPVLLHRTSLFCFRTTKTFNIRPIEPARAGYFFNFRCKGAVRNRISVRVGSDGTCSLVPDRCCVLWLFPCALSFLAFWLHVCSKLYIFLYSHGSTKKTHVVCSYCCFFRFALCKHLVAFGDVIRSLVPA